MRPTHLLALMGALFLSACSNPEPQTADPRAVLDDVVGLGSAHANPSARAAFSGLAAAAAQAGGVTKAHGGKITCVNGSTDGGSDTGTLIGSSGNAQFGDSHTFIVVLEKDETATVYVNGADAPAGVASAAVPDVSDGIQLCASGCEAGGWIRLKGNNRWACAGDGSDVVVRVLAWE